MKNSQIAMLFGLLFLCLLQIPSSNASFSKTNPIYNVNLAPFIQRLSAYYCLQNTSSNCTGNFILSEKGWLNISNSETNAFCGELGCAQHTLEVLKCVRYVHDEYTFENGATIDNLNDTIHTGCSKGFNGTSLYKSSGTTRSVTATLYALVFLALFYV
ncbi:hypothetical protein SSX86_015394 [Deinandra increscens subsp. villosa]|uniref:DUF7731 domain-containing protein n=1 Tax=Deinandra increscens subsp. villosa TaxID=3103831 RepID=A0AAP0D496_9ASTR